MSGNRGDDYMQSQMRDEEGPKYAPNPKPEMINHPAHYGGDSLYEVIKVMEAWLTPEEFRGAMKFNIHKYLARAGKKGSASEDASKAAWYAAYLEKYNKRLLEQLGG